MRDLKFMAIIILFASCSSCRKNMNQFPLSPSPAYRFSLSDTVGASCNKTFPIEAKEVNDQLARAVIIVTTGFDNVIYLYLDKRDSILGTGVLQMDINRSAEEIKDDVFSVLSLQDLKDIEFKKSHELTNYLNGGNFNYAGNEIYTWLGYGGTSHTGNGRTCVVPYNTITRTFGNKFRVPRPVDGSGLQGTGSFVVGNKIHNISSIYKSAPNLFTHIAHAVSNDLTGLTWQPEDTILWKTGTHGGEKETWGTRFNPYGKPVNPRNKEWFVSWYEHNSLGTWKTNYLWSDNDFETFQNFNIPQQAGDKVGEFFFIDAGDNRMIAIGRRNFNAPMMQYVCWNTAVIPHVWSAGQPTNLGSGLGHTMGAGINTSEYGIVIVYGDRGTYDVKMSMNNDVETVINNPMGYNTGKTIYTMGTQDPYKPLAYPCIARISQYNLLIGFSEHIGSTANLIIGAGNPKNFLP